MYLQAVPEAFGRSIDYAMLHKVYGNDPEGQTRYSPAQCLGTKRQSVIGRPKAAHISTSYIERQNLTMRMSMSGLGIWHSIWVAVIRGDHFIALWRHEPCSASRAASMWALLNASNADLENVTL